MRQILLSFILIFTTISLFAQDCEPNLMYSDSVGVYPVPFVEGVGGEPSVGGIADTACINMEYSTAFTIIVNTFTLQGIEITPDWLTIDSIINLPEGLTYQCNPGNCEYLPSIPGCATIYGTPTGDAGEYSLIIHGTAYIAGGLFSQAITFPDENLAPGEYVLHVREEGNVACEPSTTEAPAAIQEVQVSPNPFSGSTQIGITATAQGEYKFQVVDLFGKSIYQANWNVEQGTNNFTFDGSNLANGIYIYTISQGNKLTSGKLVVSQ